MTSLLPTDLSLESYRKIHGDPRVWNGALGEIRRRHSVNERVELFDANCSNVVAGGRSLVIKLYVPLWSSSGVEKLALTRVSGKLPLATPELLFEGELEGWPYIGMSRLPGRPMAEVWEQVPFVEKVGIARQVSGLIAALRTLPVDGLELLRAEWRALAADQPGHFYRRQREQETDTDLIEECRAYLERSAVRLDDAAETCFLDSDLTADQLLLERDGSGWRLSGLLDFGDAMVGQAEYELVAPLIEVAAGNPSLVQALLSELYRPEELKPALADRLMSFVLLHRYAELGDLSRRLCGEKSPASFDEIKARLLPF